MANRVEHATDTDREHPFPVLLFQIQKSPGGTDRRVVHHDVEPTENSCGIVTSDMTHREKLEAYLRLHVDNAIKYQTYYQVLTADQHQLSTQALRNYRSWARDVNHATEQLLSECAKAGVIRADLDVATASNLLNGMLVSITRWYRPSGRMGTAEIYDQVHGLLAGFIRPADGE